MGPIQRVRMNHMIRISPVRVIGPHNEQIGVIDTDEARRMAAEQGLDLVEIQPDVRPPVCKIMDYGKHKYEQSKKQQKSRANARQQEMKEIRLGRSVKIDPHDVKIRVDQARKFLMAGHKVQLTQR
jgi:translation initiation factor IF-3